jgi:hypothetical protein
MLLSAAAEVSFSVVAGALPHEVIDRVVMHVSIMKSIFFFNVVLLL